MLMHQDRRWDNGRVDGDVQGSPGLTEDPALPLECVDDIHGSNRLAALMREREKKAAVRGFKGTKEKEGEDGGWLDGRGSVSECEWLDGYGFGMLREKNDVGLTMEDGSVEASEVEGGGEVAQSVWLRRGWKVMDEGDDGFDDGGIRVSDGGGF
ncbi:hypothetical protein PIB30_098299 [Stylosanthes scabra]|uniref:Uncharacterized protein n=1 Tax=Stylosanthes scabra TaxID=79078 RepID=A0ABU6UVE5_9FABA|nr:hypothetical protein [Stylosanthes scabra]